MPQVKNSEWLLNVSKRVIGETATHGIVKASFFAHFCAGENELDMQPTLKKLESVGVGAILDYAAEKDVKEDDASDQRCVFWDDSCAVPCFGPAMIWSLGM